LKHGLYAPLCEGHEAAVILQRGQTVGVVSNADSSRKLRGENGFVIFPRDPVHPAAISFDRAIETNGVLLDNIASRLDFADGKLEVFHQGTF